MKQTEQNLYYPSSTAEDILKVLNRQLPQIEAEVHAGKTPHASEFKALHILILLFEARMLPEQAKIAEACKKQLSGIESAKNALDASPGTRALIQHALNNNYHPMGRVGTRLYGKRIESGMKDRSLANTSLHKTLPFEKNGKENKTFKQ